MNRENGLIFIHIPKTGGTTVFSLLQKNNPLKKIRQIYTLAERRAFRSLPEEKKEPCNLVSGHFPYGLHEDLPARSWQYLVMLREPAARVASFYFHVLRHPDHYLYAKITEKGPVSFEVFIQKQPPVLEMDNLQVRYLSNTLDKAVGTLTVKDFEKALRVLTQDITAFGILERFDDSIAHFADCFQWRFLEYVPLNQSPPSCETFVIDPAVRRNILKRNRLDEELYRTAFAVFSTRISAASF